MAKQGLTKSGFKDQFGLKFGRGGNRREREGRAKEEEEKRKKKSQAKKVWNLDFCMETKLKYGFMEF